MKEFNVNENNSGQRLDKYLQKILKNASVSFIYKNLRKKNIKLNDKKAEGKEILKNGDNIKIYFSDETFNNFSGSGHDAGEDSYIQLSELASKYFLSEKTDGKLWGINNKLSSELKSDKRPLGKENLNIIFEDEDKIIINKPSGLLSQKAAPDDISVNELACAYLIATNQLSKNDYDTFHPSVVNRLDINTSGLIIFAKNYKAARELSTLIKNRNVKKLYHAIVKGNDIKDEMLNGYLIKDEKNNKVSIISKSQFERQKSEKQKADFDDAKPIKTSIKVLKRYEDTALIEVHLITGRSHQIRAHLSSINHPIVGDYKYGDKAFNDRYKKAYGVKSQLLHAYSITFENGQSFVAEEPKEFSYFNF